MMALDGKRILIVEDEYLIAADLASAVAASGGKAVMVGSIDAALDIVAAAGADGAILEIKLNGERTTFRLADALAAHQIPYVFATSMSRLDAPAHHAKAPWFEKPRPPPVVLQALDGVICPGNHGRC